MIAPLLFVFMSLLSWLLLLVVVVVAFVAVMHSPSNQWINLASCVPPFTEFRFDLCGDNYPGVLSFNSHPLHIVWGRKKEHGTRNTHKWVFLVVVVLGIVVRWFLWPTIPEDGRTQTLTYVGCFYYAKFGGK